MIDSKHIAQIILNVVLIATFITIFYFTYAKNIEEQILTKQMQYITNTLLDDFSLFIPKDKYPLMKQTLQNIKTPDMSNEDAKVASSNSQVEKQTFMVLIPVVVASLLVIFFLAYKFDFSLQNIFIQGIMTLVVVGAVEFVFLKYLGGNFYSADPNYVKFKIVDEIQKNININNNNNNKIKLN